MIPQRVVVPAVTRNNAACNIHCRAVGLVNLRSPAMLTCMSGVTVSDDWDMISGS